MPISNTLLAYMQISITIAKNDWFYLVSFLFVDMDNQKLPCRACGGTHSRCFSRSAICSSFTDFSRGSKSFEIGIWCAVDSYWMSSKNRDSDTISCII